MSLPLVSIIMPAYNADKYIAEAIQSVMVQSYQNWELIIINDGSIDDTKKEVQKFEEARIYYFEQENKGVSAARNLGLKKMKGEFFCFLDADDLMTENSIQFRITVLLENSKLAFCTGGQITFSGKLNCVIRVAMPEYSGFPRKGLVSIDEKCFINCGTWMIRRKNKFNYLFEEKMTHCEDLTFFLSIADHGVLQSIEHVVQYYRHGTVSAMSNLNELGRGYRQFYQYAKTSNNFNSIIEMYWLQFKIIKIMILSFGAVRQYKSLLKFLIQW